MKPLTILAISSAIVLAGFAGCCGVLGFVINAVKPTPEQLAAMEAKQQAADQRRIERQADIGEHLDAFLVFAKDAPVEQVSASGDTLTVTVSNEYFLVNKQIRLQIAQNFLKLWQTVHCPEDPEYAGLKIVDVNGNEVGGRGITGVWVAE